MKFSIAVGAALILAGVGPASAHNVGFQGLALGQSIEEARRAEIMLRDDGASLRCTNESDAPMTLLGRVKPASSARVLCRHYVYKYGSDSISDALITPEISASLTLTFYLNKLVGIELAADRTATSLIENGLKVRFSEPSDVQFATLENRFGAKTEQRIVEWKINTNSVVMRSPDLTTERMTVSYFDLPGIAAMQAVEDAAESAAAAM